MLPDGQELEWERRRGRSWGSYEGMGGKEDERRRTQVDGGVLGRRGCERDGGETM